MGLPTFTGTDPTRHAGAIGNGLFGVEGTILPGEALADYLGFFIDQDRHEALG